MLTSVVRFFCQKHLLVNLLTLLVFLGGVVAWQSTNKEELPDITFNVVRISTQYAGASAADVEYYITKPLEEALQSFDGIQKLTSTSSPGRSSIAVELDRTVDNIDQAVTDITTLTRSVQLPDDVDKDPQVRVFETSKKAIIDIALYHRQTPLLDQKGRLALQNIARGLESTLVSQPEIYTVNRRGYLKEDINITLDPQKIVTFELPITKVAQEIRKNHNRVPVGSLSTSFREQVTIESSLDTKQVLSDLVIHGSFDTPAIRLGDVARVTDAFADQTSIYKVDGREAIILNVVKNSSVGILEALEKVTRITSDYQRTILKDSGFKLVLLDDESQDVRNRLKLLKNNGLLGFCLIVLTLLIFLNKRSAFWVALGLPFTLCFTLICSALLGYSINGITLAAIIIVLGIVVDDAIIVAENISRKINAGIPLTKAAVDGTVEVLPPVLASILTTCAAFLPLFFFSGRFSSFIIYIPIVIFLMLLASLFESFFLLPSHMTLFQNKHAPSTAKKWFEACENVYEKALRFLLRYRILIVICFVGLMGLSVLLVKSEFKFVLFTQDESREVVISGVVKSASVAKQTALAIQPLEDYLVEMFKDEKVGVRTIIGLGRRGSADRENVFRTTLELVPSDQRQKSANQIIQEIKAFTTTIPELEKISFRKRRYGQEAGSTFEIVIQENNDERRDKIQKELMKLLEDHPLMTNVEEDRILTKKGYTLNYKQEMLKKLSIDPASISETLRVGLNGKKMYSIFRNDEEVDVLLTVEPDYKQSVKKLLTIPISNVQKYLIPLGDLVSINQTTNKQSIRRENMKRTSYIYADPIKGSPKSPLEIAEECERTLFPAIIARYPTAQISFDGEIFDTRQSRKEFLWGVSGAVILIYVILALLFNSLLKPFRVMLIIPFGVIGVIGAFYLHNKTMFGFYAAIGTLGMLGVVVNDAILMLNKLDLLKKSNILDNAYTASIAKTRLRAVVLTTLTTVAGVIPTAYGIGGEDAMLADMMLALAWGLILGTLVTLILTPCVFMFEQDLRKIIKKLIPGRSLLMMGMIIFLGTSINLRAETYPLTFTDFIEKSIAYDKEFKSLLKEQLKLTYFKDAHAEAEEQFVSVVGGLYLQKGDSGIMTDISFNYEKPRLGQSVKATLSVDTLDQKRRSTGLTFSQDIARNAFGKSVQLQDNLLDIKTQLMHYQIVEAYEDYVAGLMTMYFDWMRDVERHRMAQSSLQENQKVLESVLKRQVKKIANETDVSKVKLQLLAKEEQVLMSQLKRDQRQAMLKQAMGVTHSMELIPSGSINQFDDYRHLASIFQDLSHSRSFKTLDLLRSQTDTDVSYLKRNLMPSLTWSTIFLHQQQSNSYENTAISQVSLGLPLKNINAESLHKQALVEKDNVDIETAATQESLQIQIRNIVAALESQTKRINIAKQKRVLAAYIFKEESKNYSYGNVTLNDYIDAVNRFDSIRLEELDHIMTRQQLCIELKRLTDTLVKSKGTERKMQIDIKE
ncbi:MAG: efflux RND transporter permease subunit [bacterium]